MTSTAGQALGYLPAAPRPLLYSIGTNGVDDGGKYAEKPHEPPEFGKYDIPFFLNGDRPKRESEEQREEQAAEPATQPASQTAGEAP